MTWIYDKMGKIDNIFKKKRYGMQTGLHSKSVLINCI